MSKKNNEVENNEVDAVEIVETIEDVIESDGTVSGDYDSGITNFRVLAIKHNKSVGQIASYLRKK